MNYPELLSSSVYIEEVFVEFCQSLRNKIVTHSPLKRLGNGPFPSWFTEDLRPLVLKKKRLHIDYKATVLSTRQFLTDANKCEGNVSSIQKKIINII